MTNNPADGTITLGRALCWNIGLPFAGAYLYFNGTSLRIVITSCVILFVALNVYLLFAFGVWGGYANRGSSETVESNEAVGSSAKRRLTLIFWAVGSGGAIIWTCFWLFGLVYGIVHHWHFSLLGPLVPLVAAGFGIMLTREGLKTFRQEKNPK